MKIVFKTVSAFLLFTALISCRTEDISLKALDDIPQTKYYTADIMPDSFKNVYGSWKVAKTSGGFNGIGYKNDFDYLLIKKNAIFGIIRNDSLIAFGKIILTQDKQGLISEFVAEKSSNIELCGDNMKYMQLINSDSLILFAPCCDRYNIHFIRSK
jgi:hypothetical protein